jgi:PAS domain S-box-containing protein
MNATRLIKRLLNLGSGSRVSKRLVILIIAFSSLITLIISAIQLVHDYQQQRKELIDTLEQVALYVPNIAASVWNFDQQQVILTLETLVRLPNSIEKVSVRTEGIDMHWSAGKVKSPHVVSKVFPLHHQSGASDETIGTLEVVGSLDAIYRNVALHALSILVSNGLKTFLVALFMFFLFRRLVTDRLEELARSVAGLEPLVLASGAPPHTEHVFMHGDEIDRLQRAFDEMGRKLKHAVGELRDSRQLLQSILDNSPALIIVKDLEGKLFLINRRFGDLFHMNPNKLNGQTAYDIFPHDAAAAMHAADMKVIETGKAVENELTFPQDDGLHTYIAIKAPLFDEAGKLHAICAVATDITERKQAEEELMRHRNHLEDMVRERNAELVIAKERAEVANRTKSTFLTNMTHELRTPLNAILGYARILAKDTHLNERQRNGLDTIRQSGEHLLNLITDLLDLSRIEAGKFELDTHAVNLRAFLQLIGDIIRIRAEQKGLAFRLYMAANLPTTVQVDERRLRQVLLNLLGNAVKFSERGEVCLCVQKLRHRIADVTLRFEVQDSGPGIPADQLQTIFNPFEQVGDAQRRHGGSGLGLSISRQLVKLMGSDILVYSRLGAGSHFWFELTLPCGDKEATQPLPDTATMFRTQQMEDEKESDLTAPPYEQLKALHKLALGGNMREIVHWAEHLQALDEKYAPFANKLRRLSNAYQSKAILAMVEQHLRQQERTAQN